MKDLYNGKMIKGLAFEKAVLEILRRNNPTIKDNYCEESFDSGFSQRYHYDAVINNVLNLFAFDKGMIKGNRIAIEIKAGHTPIENLRRFVCCTEKHFDAIVFILAVSKSESVEAKLKSEKSKIYFIFKEDLIKNDEINKILNNFDEYIMSDKNIVLSDNFTLLEKIKSDLAFAIGAGCSKNSNISDWKTLCEALGYELLYSIMDKKESVYKNKIISEELNNNIFSCFDKNSALDAIYNSFIKSPLMGKRDYWLSIKKVLYMNYDSPKDAKQPLVDAIVSCIKRRNIEDIINYNFDSVIEQNFNSKYKSNNKEIEQSFTNISGCKIYHVHGYIPYDYDGKTDVNNFIFTDKEYYENMMDVNSFSNVTQNKILYNKNVIFVGVSFTDSNMKEILRKRLSRGCSNSIFAFFKLPKFNFEGVNNKLMENKYKLIQESYFDSLGVKVLWVHDFGEIPGKIDLI